MFHVKTLLAILNHHGLEYDTDRGCFTLNDPKKDTTMSGYASQALNERPIPRIVDVQITDT